MRLSPDRGRSRPWRLVTILVAGGAATVALLLLARALRSADHPGDVAFVADAACARCHEAQYRAWSGSHHDRAMQVADDRTVLGNFDDARFTHRGVTSRFFRRDGKFVVTTEGPGGTPADFEIKYTFGVSPLQQYLIEFPGGRLQSLSIAWDTTRKRWFHLYPDETIAPGDPRHWTGRYQTWNLMCAECHTTNLRKNYDLKTDAYTTTWTALGVGCQACHGPGEAHVAWASGRTGSRDPGLLVRFRTTEWRLEVDNCGRCHARRTRLDAAERPGHPFLDEVRPELLRAGLYDPDGQQLDEVYEWASFLQSRMYRMGVRCTDCHDAHSARKSADNVVCTRCHRALPEARFPGLAAKVYDSPTHHFHAAGTAGARCVSCHMPARTYMGVDARRDHSIRVPRPDLSVRLGTPNACNACHKSRSPRWAVAALERWYGPKARPAPHYGEVIAAGRMRAREAEPALIALAGDAAQAAIVRATALDLLRGYGPGGMAAMVAATKDEDAMVRAAAVGGLDGLPPKERLAPVAPLLSDPIRAVRIEAARVLAPVPAGLLDRSQRRAFDRALAEFTEAQRAMADAPWSHLNLGVLHASRSERDQAEQSYLTALRMDPRLVPARTNLVTLYNETGRNLAAEKILKEGIRLTPARGELHYSLGLVLLEEKRLAEATDELAEAAKLLPDRARVRYNYGLALQQLGRRAEAEAALLRARELDRGDPKIAYALAVFYIQQQEYQRALGYARRLTELAPEDPAPRQLVERIRRRLDAGTRPAR